MIQLCFGWTKWDLTITPKKPTTTTACLTANLGKQMLITNGEDLVKFCKEMSSLTARLKSSFKVRCNSNLFLQKIAYLPLPTPELVGIHSIQIMRCCSILWTMMMREYVAWSAFAWHFWQIKEGRKPWKVLSSTTCYTLKVVLLSD